MRILGFEINSSLFGNRKAKTKNIAPGIIADPEPLVEVPIRGGMNAGESVVIGSVMPTDVTAYTGIGLSQRPLSKKDYEQLYSLAASNHDVSFAVSNIVELANTKITIKFDTDVSPEMAEEMMVNLKEAEKKWYQGGRPMLINSLFRQVAITGAISGEGKPTADLRGVGNVTLLSPKWVYFFYNEPTSSYLPYQQVVVNSAFLSRITSPNRGYGYNKLSTKTYKYIAISRDEDKPYAIPPIWSAIEAVCIENDMLDNLAAIVKRLGMFGFLQVIVNAPTRGKRADGQPETDEDYINRVQDYIASLEPEIEKGLSNGYVITAKQIDQSGTERKTEFNMTASTHDATGGSKLLELIMQIKAAGLKQDPVFLGKNFSTSEALAKVLLKKFSGQLADYQEAAAQFLQHVYELHLRLQGFDFKYIDVSFEPPILEDTKTLYEGLNLKFDYGQKLYRQGIIDQTGFAQFMGYEAPAEDEPLMAPDDSDTGEPTEPTDDDGESDTDDDNGDQSSSSLSFEQLSKRSEQKYKTMHKGYNRDTMGNMKEAAQTVSERVINLLSMLPDSQSLESIQKWVRQTVLMDWNATFTKAQLSTTHYWVDKSYKTFRKDRSIFKGKRKNPQGEKIPAAKMDALDNVSLRHFESIDILAIGSTLFTGKTLEAIDSLVKEYYEKEALPLGENAKNAAQFRREIAKILKLGSGEIMKITGTTMANIRAVSGLMYLHQSKFDNFELSGPAALVCSNCSPVEGNVLESMDNFSKFLKTGQRNVLMPPVALVGAKEWNQSESFEICKCRIYAKTE